MDHERRRAARDGTRFAVTSALRLDSSQLDTIAFVPVFVSPTRGKFDVINSLDILGKNDVKRFLCVCTETRSEFLTWSTETHRLIGGALERAGRVMGTVTRITR